MENTIKELLDEFIDYRKNRKPIKFLKKAYEDLGDKQIVVLIGWLLQWQKETTLGWKSLEKYDISEVLHNGYEIFFQKCPQLNNVFVLNKDNISWVNTLTDDEKTEIRDYIHANYKIPIRIRQRKP